MNTITTETRKVSFRPNVDTRFLSDEEIKNIPVDETEVVILRSKTVPQLAEERGIKLEGGHTDIFCMSIAPGANDYREFCSACTARSKARTSLYHELCKGLRKEAEKVFGDFDGRDPFVLADNGELYIITQGPYTGIYIRLYPGSYELKPLATSWRHEISDKERKLRSRWIMISPPEKS